MRKREIGQAFILVLILLGVGALLVVPALRLTGTSLMSSQIVERQVKGLYAADAAQEWVLWSLTQPGFTDQLPEGEPVPFDIDVCGTHVDITIVMQALEGKGGTILATDDKIKPTKEVTPSYVDVKREELYTYTISLDYLSDINEDNPKVYLDAIYDLPPGDFGSGAYQEGTSQLSLDGGDTWLDVPDPEWNAAKGYLKWPDDYNYQTREGAFSSHPEFYGIEDFEVREVKKLRFEMRGTLADNDTHSNWVVLKMGDEDNTSTLSGPQALIKVGGDPDIPPVSEDDSVLEVTKESSPRVILPGVTQEVTYIISITNMYTQTRNIETIVDYLPPGFQYAEFLDSTLDGEPIEILDPDVPNEPEDVNGVLRYPVQWSTTQFGGSDLSIGSDETLELTFTVKTTQDVSGSYYNEVVVLLRETGLPPGFADVGVTLADFATNYSWNTGAVLVPYYDSQADADGTIINANLSIIEGGAGAVFTSWQVD